MQLMKHSLWIILHAIYYPPEPLFLLAASLSSLAFKISEYWWENSVAKSQYWWLKHPGNPYFHLYLLNISRGGVISQYLLKWKSFCSHSSGQEHQNQSDMKLTSPPSLGFRSLNYSGFWEMQLLIKRAEKNCRSICHSHHTACLVLWVPKEAG